MPEVAVSVIVPMYNARAWVQQTLESVAAQTLPRDQFELIVIDDASRDDSADIARSFIEEHGLQGRVIVRERNMGVSPARNLGWQQAAAEWVQFLDADDLLAPGKLQAQVARAAQLDDSVAVVFSPWQHLALCDDTWQPVGPVIEPDVEQDTIVRILHDFSFGYVGPTLIRKAWLARVDGLRQELNIGEDIDLMLRMAMAGGRFVRACSDRPLFFYREREDSLWRQSFANAQSMRNLVGIFRRTETYLRSANGGLSGLARESLANRYLRPVEFFMDHDLATFDEVMGWIDELRLPQLPGLGGGMQAMSRVIGNKNALRLRHQVRRARGR